MNRPQPRHLITNHSTHSVGMHPAWGDILNSCQPSPLPHPPVTIAMSAVAIIMPASSCHPSPLPCTLLPSSCQPLPLLCPPIAIAMPTRHHHRAHSSPLLRPPHHHHRAHCPHRRGTCQVEWALAKSQPPQAKKCESKCESLCDNCELPHDNCESPCDNCESMRDNCESDAWTRHDKP
jgi:hypothetical protein